MNTFVTWNEAVEAANELNQKSRNRRGIWLPKHTRFGAFTVVWKPCR